MKRVNFLIAMLVAFVMIIISTATMAQCANGRCANGRCNQQTSVMRYSTSNWMANGQCANGQCAIKTVNSKLTVLASVSEAIPTTKTKIVNGNSFPDTKIDTSKSTMITLLNI